MVSSAYQKRQMRPRQRASERQMEKEVLGVTIDDHRWASVNLTIPLAAKLGSILVHVDEYSADGGHRYDLDAARSLLDDIEVRQWLAHVASLGLLPRKRGERG